MHLDTTDLDAATADAVAGEFGRASRHALPIGTPCPNCRTPLAGPWCHACGQKGEAYQRSIWHLAAEAFEGLTHFDGRVWKTLPRLAFRPGELTRDYLDGHRASQIQPFRLFLIVLVALFFAGGLNATKNKQGIQFATINSPEVRKELSPQDRASLDKATQAFRNKIARPRTESAGSVWLRQRLVHAMDNREAFKVAIEAWSHRLAILMLPIAALMLSVLFLFKRDVYVFDHLIFSMHSLSFQGLLISATFLLTLAGSWGSWLLLAAPVHLFVHMRGTYRTSVIGTLLRMFVLFVGSTVAFALLMVGLLFIGLAMAN